MEKKEKTRSPITVEDFYSIHHVGQPCVHPSGRYVAFVKEIPQREGRSYTRSIWIGDVRTGKVRQFTAGGKDGDYAPAWSPDGKQLAFVSHRDGGTPQIFIIPFDGGEARPFTKMIHGVSRPVWSPDGSFIAYLSRVNEEERNEEKKRRRTKFLDERALKRLEEDRKYKEEQKADPRVYTRTVVKSGTSFRDDRTYHIYIQPVKGGRPVRLTEGDFDYMNPVWSPDGRFILTASKQEGDPDIIIRADLFRIDVKEKTIHRLTSDDHADYLPCISPDGKWIYFLSFMEEKVFQQRTRIRRIPWSGGTPELFIPDFEYDIPYIDLSPDGAYLYFLVAIEGQERIGRINTATRQIEMFVEGNGMAGEFHVRKRTLAYRWEAPDIPSDIFTKDVITGKEKRLTRVNRKFLSRKVVSEPKEIRYKSIDGLEIQGWYMLPYDYRKGERYPWIVQIHGGPHIMWGYSWWHEFQAMCAEGYGVFFCNPRGSDGYGTTFKGAIHNAWGERDYKDILAGIDKIVEMGLADPRKLYLTGGSFGGFMTAWIVSHDHRFKAAVAQRGVYNFISMYGASDALTLIEWEFDTLPWENTEHLWEHSPLKYVADIKTPLMILHSERDYRVGISNADELYVALRRLGKEAEYVRYPREGHELSRSGEPKHRVDRIKRIIDWFKRHD